jgi:glycogen(starch) synthase
MDGDRTASLLLTADTVGGVWTYAVELARGLAAQGVQVHLATMGAPVCAHQRRQVDAAGITLHESRHRLEWMQQPWGDVDRAGQWLLGLEARLQPDVVHLNQFAFGALPFAAPTLLVAHSCVLSWWQAVHGEAPGAEWHEYRSRVAQGLAGASLVAAPTHAMLRTLAGNYGVRRQGLVLPNARDPDLFAPARKEPFVLAAGRFWDEAKNLAALDAAAQGLPWPVRVAGSCSSPDGTTREPRIARALGELPAPALARCMAHASIYALPARYEPFGLSILEAALSGCALVLGDIDSLRESWEGAALFVPPEDTRALHHVLQTLIADPAQRAQLGAAARKQALHFHPSRMVQATLFAYGGLQPASAHRPKEELACA